MPITPATVQQLPGTQFPSTKPTGMETAYQAFASTLEGQAAIKKEETKAANAQLQQWIASGKAYIDPKDQKMKVMTPWMEAEKAASQWGGGVSPYLPGAPQQQQDPRAKRALQALSEKDWKWFEENNINPDIVSNNLLKAGKIDGNVQRKIMQQWKSYKKTGGSRDLRAELDLPETAPTSEVAGAIARKPYEAVAGVFDDPLTLTEKMIGPSAGIEKAKTSFWKGLGGETFWGQDINTYQNMMDVIRILAPYMSNIRDLGRRGPKPVEEPPIEVPTSGGVNTGGSPWLNMGNQMLP